MKTKNLFTIKFVSVHTGLKPHVIRAWESRYGAVVPERTQTNRRIYCKQDMQKLRLLKKATEAGHQISRIARASVDELNSLLSLSGAANGQTADAPSESKGRDRTEAHYREACLKSVIALEPETLNRVLSEAAVHLTRQRWVEGVVVPIFRQIGELWSSGRLKIVNEHIASNCARTIMGDMLRSVEIASNAPRIIVGTPLGQWHELGALAAALASADAGWRPVYVGANLPSEELAAAVERFNAACIALSITHSIDDNRLQRELIDLRRYIGPGRGILVGGGHQRAWQGVLEHIGAHRVSGWQDFSKILQNLIMR